MSNQIKNVKMKKICLFILLVFIVQQSVQAQGCIAIRSTGVVCTKPHEEGVMKGWQLNTSYRYFKSFRHFVGTEEQKERLEKNTEVINWQHSMDISLVRILNNRWSVAMNAPVISNKRSSLYEHYGNNSSSPVARQNTKSFGIGDIRFIAYRWLFNPATATKGNVQLGLGIKLPTGDYKVQDFFHKLAKDGSDSLVLGMVDQSIQLGDGGTGFTADINAYYNFSTKFSVYGNFYYLLNPREHNGVSRRNGTPSASDLKYGTSTFSVPDQYMVRLGANYSLQQFGFSAGLRHECVPSKDLVGGSSGFRRPGYVISAEPGINYNFKKIMVYATAPIALKRDRTQSNADKLQTQATGVHRQGDAAFADYSVNIGVSIKL